MRGYAGAMIIRLLIAGLLFAAGCVADRGVKTSPEPSPLRIVIIGLRAGSSLREHHAPGPISIQALSGSVVVSTQGRSDPLDAGQVLAFGSAVAHSVTANADAVVLLTIAWPERQ